MAGTEVRIGCISPSYLPRVGGGEKYAHRLNAALVKRAATVYVLTSVPPAMGETTLDGVTIEYVRAGTFVGFPWFNLGDLLRIFRKWRPHIILAYGPSPYDPLAAIISTLLGCPYVQVYHADFNDTQLITRFATWLHNLTALRFASAIICTNEHMHEVLRQRGFSDRTIVATPGVDNRFFAADTGAGVTSDLLFVGALDDAHKYKRLDILLATLAEFRKDGTSVHLTVIGDGNRRTYFESLTRELGLTDSVTFLGGITDEELALQYATSSVLVLPSPTTQEGFGLVCLEAMAASLPVVCSKNAGVAEIVREAPAGALWDGANITDLKTAILIARKSTRAERERLRTYTVRYGWDAMCAHLLEALADRLPTVPFTMAE